MATPLPNYSLKRTEKYQSNEDFKTVSPNRTRKGRKELLADSEAAWQDGPPCFPSGSSGNGFKPLNLGSGQDWRSGLQIRRSLPCLQMPALSWRTGLSPKPTWQGDICQAPVSAQGGGGRGWGRGSSSRKSAVCAQLARRLRGPSAPLCGDQSVSQAQLLQVPLVPSGLAGHRWVEIS